MPLSPELEAKLPDVAYVDNSWNRSPGVAPVIAVKKGESGYYPIYTRLSAKELNEASGVTEAQAQAMHVGSLFGWDCPGADPDHPSNYYSNHHSKEN